MDLDSVHIYKHQVRQNALHAMYEHTDAPFLGATAYPSPLSIPAKRPPHMQF